MAQQRVWGFFVGLILAIGQAEAGINIPLEKGVDPPPLLSATGLFQGDLANLIPAEGVIPFDINQPLWVDYATKQRFLYLPPGGKIRFPAQEKPDDFWRFPVGTILVKHFRMEVSFHVFQNLETRILVHKAGEGPENWEGYTYQWKDGDAHLVDATKSPEVQLTVDLTAEGGAREQIFKIPSRRMCLQCHNASVGFVRGVRTEQILRDYGGVNQLEAWSKKGLFESPTGATSGLPRFPNIRDESASPEARAKAYLEVNCAHCHNPSPEAMCSFTGIDFRAGHLNIEELVGSGHLVKGSRARSEIYNRMDSVVPGTRMPYIGSRLKDAAALDVIGRWIDGL